MQYMYNIYNIYIVFTIGTTYVQLNVLFYPYNKFIYASSRFSSLFNLNKLHLNQMSLINILVMNLL